MSYEYDVKFQSFIASTDMSGCLNRLVDLSTTPHKVVLPAAGGGYGVLKNKPQAGEHASVAIDGVVMVRVGAAVTAGDLVTSAASGWVVGVTSGAACKAARVLTTAASGMLAALKLPFTQVATG